MQKNREINIETVLYIQREIVDKIIRNNPDHCNVIMNAMLGQENEYVTDRHVPLQVFISDNWDGWMNCNGMLKGELYIKNLNEFWYKLIENEYVPKYAKVGSTYTLSTYKCPECDMNFMSSGTARYCPGCECAIHPVKDFYRLIEVKVTKKEV